MEEEISNSPQVVTTVEKVIRSLPDADVTQDKHNKTLVRKDEPSLSSIDNVTRHLPDSADTQDKQNTTLVSSTATSLDNVTRHTTVSANSTEKDLPPCQVSSKDVSNLPIIYLITPTYARLTQKVDLTRLIYTMRQVPRIHWIIVEDAAKKSKLIPKLFVSPISFPDCL